MKVTHLKTGWEDEYFEAKINMMIRKCEEGGIYEYYDIKISSKGNNCLLIFKEVLE